MSASLKTRTPATRQRTAARYDRKKNFITTQISLTWLISSVVIVLMFMITTAISVVVNTHDMTTKIDNFLATVGMLTKRQDDTVINVTATRELLYAQQRVSDAQDLRIKSLERDQDHIRK